MGRGALTLFPVCAATGAQGGAAAQASGLGAVPPAGGRQARSARRLRRPPGPPQAPAFFRITLPPAPPQAPAPPQPPASRRHTGRRPSRPAGAAFGGLRPPRRRRRRPSGPPRRPGGPPRRPCGPPRQPSHNPRPTPANSPKISHETIPTKIQILYKSAPQSLPFVNFP